jgi:MraZ protein
VFRGISAVNLDTKSRLALPSRYRDCLYEEHQGQLVLTIDTDAACLLLYPLEEWELIEKKLEALPSFNRAARRIQRLLIGHATECEMDSNHRILLPPLLRDYAKLEKRVMLIGQGRKFEIWAEDAWLRERQAWLEDKTEGDETLPPELQTLSL